MPPPPRLENDFLEQASIDLDRFATQHQLQTQIREHPRFKELPFLKDNLLGEYEITTPSEIQRFREKLNGLFLDKWLTQCLEQFELKDQYKILFLLFKLAEYDIDTFWHSCRVAKASYEFASKFTLTHDELCLHTFYQPLDADNFYFAPETNKYRPTQKYIERLTISALLHDLGKISIKQTTLQQGSGQFQSANNIGALKNEITHSILTLIQSPSKNEQYLTELASNLSSCSPETFEGNTATLTELNEFPNLSPELQTAVTEIRARLLPFIMQTFDNQTPNNSREMFQTIENLCQLNISTQSKEILRNSFGLLDQEQRKEMNVHPAASKYITDAFNLPEEIGYAGINHHQQGNRYPYPREVSRIEFTVAEGIINLMDGFVAMREARVYRPPKTLEEVHKIILVNDKQADLFHPYLLRNLEEMMEKEYQSLNASTHHQKMPTGEFIAMTEEIAQSLKLETEPKPTEAQTTEPNIFHVGNINQILGLEHHLCLILIESEPFDEQPLIQKKDPRNRFKSRSYLSGLLGLRHQTPPWEVDPEILNLIPIDLSDPKTKEWAASLSRDTPNPNETLRPNLQITDEILETLIRDIRDKNHQPKSSHELVAKNQTGEVESTYPSTTKVDK